MRKLLVTVLLAASFTGFAQKLDDVKEKIDKQKWDEAREKLDKALADPKNQASPDAWFYKTKIYHNLAKKTPSDTSLASQALDAMKRYMKLEESKTGNTRMLLSTLENNQTFFDIYQTGFTGAVDQFKNQNYVGAFKGFERTLETFEYLSKYNLTPMKFDTTSTIYAGFSAQNAKMYDQAMNYYTKMVDAKVVDTNYIDAYTFLINYSLEKKDTAKAIKFLELSEAAFPQKSDLWVDYEILTMGNDKAKKMARYETLVSKYPKNFTVNMNYAIELYNNTFFSETKAANYAAEQEKTRQAIDHALSLDPSSSHGNFIYSQFYLNQIYDLEDSLRSIKGNTPADQARKKDLNARMDAKYEGMYTYSQKVYDMYAKESSLKAQDKANYRKAINQLIDYYTRKKQTDKVTEYQNKLKQL